MIDEKAPQSAPGAQNVPEVGSGGKSALKRLLRPARARFVQADGDLFAFPPHVALGPDIWRMMGILHRK